MRVYVNSNHALDRPAATHDQTQHNDRTHLVFSRYFYRRTRRIVLYLSLRPGYGTFFYSTIQYQAECGSMAADRTDMYICNGTFIRAPLRQSDKL